MNRLLSLVALMILVAMPASAQYALQFGAAVAVGDDQIFVGEGRNLLMPGSVFVYERAEDGAWMQADVLTPEGAQDEALGFGRALSVSGTTLVVRVYARRGWRLDSRKYADSRGRPVRGERCG